MFLLLHPNGGKYWRWNYRFDGKKKTLSFGTYPLIPLAEARRLRDRNKKLVGQGIDPNELKKEKQRQQEVDAQAQFATIAKDWWNAQLPRWTSNHAKRLWHSLEEDVLPALGNRDSRTLKAPDIMQVLRQIETRGVNETAIRIWQRIKSIFNYGIQIGLLENNLALSLTGVILKKREQHQLALPQDGLPEFFQRLQDMPMKAFTRIAMYLQIMWFVRPGELRQAKWDELDFVKREWPIPAFKMKMKRPHLVPLSDWSLELLEQLKQITGHSPYLFPNYRDFRLPMSENALGYVMARMGYKGKAVPLGFRSLATDVLNENHFDPDVIERQLAHVESNKVRAAYHRTEYLRPLQ